MIRSAVVMSLVFGASLPAVAAVIRVDADAPDPTHDGTSWASAYLHPQDAVDAASAGDEVWVAEGTYVRRSGSDTVVLTMKDGVAVYGGFLCTESLRDERDLSRRKVILDGEDVCEHVVAGASNAVLDGFTVTNGSAWNLIMTGSGGGMYNLGAADLIVENCVFSGNACEYRGAGMYNENSSPAITNCVFVLNQTNPFGEGGGICNVSNSSPAITNCTFTLNFAFAGGATRDADATCAATITNCILWLDSAQNGPEVGVRGPVSHSDFDQSFGFVDGGGNINADPLFVSDWPPYDLRLQAGSPCIDAADGDAARATDIEGLPRHDDPGMPNTGTGAVAYADMGAYEFQGVTPPKPATPSDGGCSSGEGAPGAVLLWVLLACLGPRALRATPRRDT